MLYPWTSDTEIRLGIHIIETKTPEGFELPSDCCTLPNGKKVVHKTVTFADYPIGQEISDEEGCIAYSYSTNAPEVIIPRHTPFYADVKFDRIYAPILISTGKRISTTPFSAFSEVFKDVEANYRESLCRNIRFNEWIERFMHELPYIQAVRIAHNIPPLSQFWTMEDGMVHIFDALCNPQRYKYHTVMGVSCNTRYFEDPLTGTNLGSTDECI